MVNWWTRCLTQLFHLTFLLWYTMGPTSECVKHNLYDALSHFHQMFSLVYFCSQVTSLITQSLSQYTRKERAIIDAVKLKFGLILLVFYLCWLPNLVNSVLLWTEWNSLPSEIVSVLLYVMVRLRFS